MHRIESSLVIILHLSSFHYVQNCAITWQLPNVPLSDGNITITLQILDVVNECIFSRAFNIALITTKIIEAVLPVPLVSHLNSKKFGCSIRDKRYV